MGVRHLAPQEAKFWLFFGPQAQPRKNVPPTATRARRAKRCDEWGNVNATHMVADADANAAKIGANVADDATSKLR